MKVKRPRSISKEPRYRLIQKEETNAVGKTVPIWYIIDIKKGRHGEYVARFYRETEANWSLEILNKRKK